jgi:hypothetical protein
LLSLLAAAAASAAAASGEIVISLTGAGTGGVKSVPVGIECSNVAGEEKEGTSECSEAFPFTGPENVQLTATPAGDAFFLAWTGTGTLDGSCSSGSVNPCKLTDPGPFGFPPVHITASFEPLPDPPVAMTGSFSPGSGFSLRTLEGAVDPEEFKVSDCRFEYGTTTAYGNTTSCVEPDASELDETSTAPIAVHAETEPLEPNTTYHYRLLASNVGGASAGEDRSFTTGPAPSSGCPNEARRLEQGVKALLLPDCMALEMASPPRKFGTLARNPNVSADGSRVSFTSVAALGEDPQGLLNLAGSLYIASRGQARWTSEGILPDVDPRLAGDWNKDSQWRPSLSPDFSRWFGIGATESQYYQGIVQTYEGGLNGFFRPLSLPFGPRTFQSSRVESVIAATQFQAASADRSHLYFRSGEKATYFPDDPRDGGSQAEPANVYLARRGGDGELALELLERDRDLKVWGGNCGARLGGHGGVEGVATGPNGARTQGAVSADGYRTYLSARVLQPEEGVCDTANKLRILERLETPTGPQIVPLFASECNRTALPNPPGPCSGADGDDLYQGASQDQSKVYFTTNRQLADSDLDGSSAQCSTTVAVAGCDLYLYDRTRSAGHHLVQVSAGEDAGAHEAGKEAKVFNGITAISADGSHVYFVAAGVLTGDANPEDKSAQEGQPNLYLWDAGSEETTFLATLDPQDGITGSEQGRGLWGGEGTWRNGAYPVPVIEQGGNGHVLVFESKAELSEADGDGAHLDVYRYDSVSETLTCLSCAPGSSPAEPDEAPFDVTAHGEALPAPIPAGTDFAERSRWVSEDGEEVALATPQGLLPGDVNGDLDFYLWRGGSVFRLPGDPFGGSQAPPEASGPLLSHDGSTVAFVTPTPLLPQDGDKSADVYVARVGGGYPEPPPPSPCEPGNPENECRRAESAPAAPQTNSEAVGPDEPFKHRRPCRRGKVRRKGHCVAKHGRHVKRRHGRRARQANTDRRAGE